MRRAVAAAMIVAGVGTAAAQQAAPPATPAGGSVQQAFDAATALSDGKDAAAAVAAWETLERRVATNRRTLAIVRLRKAGVLMRVGRLQEATEAARLGLAQLPPTDPTLAEDRAQGYIIIGRGAEMSLDYAGAAAAYSQAERASDAAVSTITALLGQIRTLTFTDSDAAMAVMRRGDETIAKMAVDKGIQAMFASAKGVLLMNRGDFAGAREATAEAVKLQGGLTSKVDLNDVSARQDAALALLLGGNATAARQYMAMTGAGRLGNDANFNPGATLTPPPCGGEAGLKPADMAVIEFSIGDDGAVGAARPIYSQGGPAVAMEFARAALDWSWTPEQLKAVPAFFRYNVRLEMRCSTAFERPSVMAPFDDSVVEWAKAQRSDVADEPSGSELAKVNAARAALAKAAGNPPAGQLPYLLRLIRSPLVSREETLALATRGLAIARAGSAPERVLLPFDLAAQRTGSVDSYRPAPFRRAVTPMLTRYQDPEVLAALRLMLADARGSATTQRAYLDPIVADTRLAKNDPLRVGALIRIASLSESKGDSDAARQAFAASGLAVNQCALVDRPPKLIAAGGTFPQEAMMWGFEGWTRVQYDVGAAGDVTNERVIVSYPPFIFSKAGAATMKGARYTKTYRPDGGVGCGAVTQQVRFKMPG